MLASSTPSLVSSSSSHRASVSYAPYLTSSAVANGATYVLKLGIASMVASPYIAIPVTTAISVFGVASVLKCAWSGVSTITSGAYRLVRTRNRIPATLPPNNQRLYCGHPTQQSSPSSDQMHIFSRINSETRTNEYIIIDPKSGKQIPVEIYFPPQYTLLPKPSLRDSSSSSSSLSSRTCITNEDEDNKEWVFEELVPSPLHNDNDMSSIEEEEEDDDDDAEEEENDDDDDAEEEENDDDDGDIILSSSPPST